MLRKQNFYLNDSASFSARRFRPKKMSAESDRFAFTHGGVKRVFQFCPLEFQLVNFLVAGVFHVLLDAADFVIELVILLERRAKLAVRQLEQADGFGVVRELFDEWMM